MISYRRVVLLCDEHVPARPAPLFYAHPVVEVVCLELTELICLLVEFIVYQSDAAQQVCCLTDGHDCVTAC